ncbi:MAG: hypothetical protein AB1746_15270 [Candidatus Zixiibacteriota bacterium]
MAINMSKIKKRIGRITYSIKDGIADPALPDCGRPKAGTGLCPQFYNKKDAAHLKIGKQTQFRVIIIMHFDYKDFFGLK